MSHNKNMINSIDSLFSAIYHRFGFLGFDKNEIDFSFKALKDYKVAVFIVGNSYLRELCSKKGDKGYERFYNKICKDKSVFINEKHYVKLTDFL